MKAQDFLKKQKLLQKELKSNSKQIDVAYSKLVKAFIYFR